MKGILFSDSMAQAVHAGTKTVTRRLIAGIRSKDVLHGVVGRVAVFTGLGSPVIDGANVKLPFKPGEIVYVKEAWAIWGKDNVAYRAVLGDQWEGGWKSSMFMPEWASRTKLRILDVRPERLQEITCGEAFLEGIEDSDYEPEQAAWHVMGLHPFTTLWNSLHKPPNDFANNPWVWRIQFEKIADTPLWDKSQSVTDAKNSVASAESSVQNNPGENNDHTR